MICTMISMKARPTRTRLQRDLGYDLIGLSAPTMLMSCSLVPWFQEYEVQLGGTREIILYRSRLRSCEAMGMEAADPILSRCLSLALAIVKKTTFTEGGL